MLRELEASPFWAQNLGSNRPTTCELTHGDPLNMIQESGGREKAGEWQTESDSSAVMGSQAWKEASVVLVQCTFWDDERMVPPHATGIPKTFAPYFE